MNEWMMDDGWMDEWMDRWMDRWIDGWIDGWMNVLWIIYDNLKVGSNL